MEEIGGSRRLAGSNTTTLEFGAVPGWLGYPKGGFQALSLLSSFSSMGLAPSGWGFWATRVVVVVVVVGLDREFGNSCCKKRHALLLLSKSNS
jgi:hypothetical protein